MALSFSRPDPSSPAAVGAAAFPVSRRGYDQGEVRDFLRMVAAELARLQEREQFLQSEVRALQTRGMSAPGRLDEDTVATLLGEEAARVLTVARDASQQIRDRAEEAATRLVKEAAEDASRIREAAHMEAARIRGDAQHDAEATVEESRREGRNMVLEAREYREKVLTELTRRREAARAQIEELIHGRERLLAAFERAQLAAQSVIGELSGAHEEPEFLVDLSPVTGPVPVVNPNHPSLPSRSDSSMTSVNDAPSIAPFDVESVSGAFPSVPEPSELSTMFTEEESVVHEQLETVGGDVEEVPGPTLSFVVEPIEETSHVVRDEISSTPPVTVSAEESAEGASFVVITAPPSEDDVHHMDHDDVTSVGEIEAEPDEDVVTDDMAVADPPAGTTDDEVVPSNIVNLFDRSRHHTVIPEEVPQIAPEHETPPAPEATPEPPARPPRILASTPDKLPPAHGRRPTRDETNSLFSALRGTPTSEVARRSSARTGGGHPVHETEPRPTRPKSVPSGVTGTTRKNENIAPAKDPRSASAQRSDAKEKESSARALHPAAPAPAAPDTAVFAVRSLTAGEVASSVARKFRRVLVDELNDVLQHLQSKRSSITLDAVLGTSNEQLDRFVRSIADDCSVAAGAGVRATQDFGSQARRVRADRVSVDVADIVEAGLVSSFRSEMATIIDGSAGDRHALTDAVRELYRRWKGDRIDGVALDVSLRAHGSGMTQSLEPGSVVAWFVDPDAPCCSDCEDNSLGGPVMTGHEFAAGSSLAPAHPGCRCLVWPVRN